MILSNKRLAKMSEDAIARQYSYYLQSVLIQESGNVMKPAKEIENGVFLSYEEFKDYYILSLVGSHNYIDKLVHKIQHKSLAN
jgi:hypothetical protein